ncbi:hypothetical protein SFIMM107S_05655 [Streptomyces griseus]
MKHAKKAGKNGAVEILGIAGAFVSWIRRARPSSRVSGRLCTFSTNARRPPMGNSSGNGSPKPCPVRE